MNFVLTDSNYKRIKVNGELSPCFEYPAQCDRFISNILGGSKYVKIVKVK